MASVRLGLRFGDTIPTLDWVNKSKDGAGFELIGAPITDQTLPARRRRHCFAPVRQRAARGGHCEWDLLEVQWHIFHHRYLFGEVRLDGGGQLSAAISRLSVR